MTNTQRHACHGGVVLLRSSLLQSWRTTGYSRCATAEAYIKGRTPCDWLGQRPKPATQLMVSHVVAQCDKADCGRWLGAGSAGGALSPMVVNWQTRGGPSTDSSPQPGNQNMESSNPIRHQSEINQPKPNSHSKHPDVRSIAVQGTEPRSN